MTRKWVLVRVKDRWLVAAGVRAFWEPEWRQRKPCLWCKSWCCVLCAHFESVGCETAQSEAGGQYKRTDWEEWNQETIEHTNDKACLFTNSNTHNSEKPFQN